MRSFKTFVTAAATLAAIGPVSASAQENLGFESIVASGARSGWRIDGSMRDGERDLEIARSGRASLRLPANDDGRGNRVAQVVSADSLRGARIRVSVHARTGPSSAASLWVRIDGEAGLLYVDGSTPARGDGEWMPLSIDAPVSTQATRISFGGGALGEGAVWFDDFSLEALDTSTWPEPAPAARRYLDHALDLIQRHSVRRDAVDWPALRKATDIHARGARTVEEMHLAVRFALGELGDRHSYFMTAGQMTSLDERPVSNARTRRRFTPPEGRVVDDIAGAIVMPGYAGGDQHAQAGYAQIMHDLIRELDAGPICGWVIDLRNNSGGNLWPMLAGIGPLLPRGEAVAALYPGGARQSLWYADGKAGLGDYVQLRVNAPYRPRAERPIAVLTSRATASSAEIILAALKSRPNTRTFGTATRGATSGTRTIPLTDGSALILAVTVTGDPNGRIYAGPIEPDVEIPDPNGRRQRGVERTAASAAALAWLRRQPGCSDS